MRAMASLVAAAWLALGATAADAGCRTRCRSTLRTCYRELCDPAEIDVSPRACRLGVRIQVLQTCRTFGASLACPRGICNVDAAAVRSPLTE